jgi:hypothetical protein
MDIYQNGQGCLEEMQTTRNPIIDRSQTTINFSLILYYIFLAGYTFYFLILRSEFLPAIIVAPIFYILLTLGAWSLILAGIALIVSVIYRSRELLGESKDRFLLGVLPIGIALGLLIVYVSPAERWQLLSLKALIFIPITIIDILIRLSNRKFLSPKDKQHWLKEIKRAAEAYPIGPLAILVLFFGFYVVALFSAPSYGPDWKIFIQTCLIYWVGFTFLYIWLYKAVFQKSPIRSPLAEKHITPEDLERTTTRANQQDPISSVVVVAILTLAMVSALALYLILNRLLMKLPNEKHFFIPLFAFFYLLLAWTQWEDLKKLRRQDMDSSILG